MANQNLASGKTGYRPYRRVKLTRWFVGEELSTWLLPTIQAGRQARNQPDQLHSGSSVYSQSHTRTEYAHSTFPIN